MTTTTAKKAPVKAIKLTALNQSIFDGIVAANKSGIATEKAKTQGAGVYATFTAIAASTGQAKFEKAMSTVFDMIRANANGLAVKAKCPKGKKDGTWTIPSAAMSAKSVLLGAMEYSVELTDDETSEPRSFTAIRKDLSAAKVLEQAAKMTHEQEQQACLLAQLALMANYVKSIEVDSSIGDAMESLTLTIQDLSTELVSIAGDDDNGAMEDNADLDALTAAMAG